MGKFCWKDYKRININDINSIIIRIIISWYKIDKISNIKLFKLFISIY